MSQVPLNNGSQGGGNVAQTKLQQNLPKRGSPLDFAKSDPSVHSAFAEAPARQDQKGIEDADFTSNEIGNSSDMFTLGSLKLPRSATSKTHVNNTTSSLTSITTIMPLNTHIQNQNESTIIPSRGDRTRLSFSTKDFLPSGGVGLSSPIIPGLSHEHEYQRIHDVNLGATSSSTSNSNVVSTVDNPSDSSTMNSMTPTIQPMTSAFSQNRISRKQKHSLAQEPRQEQIQGQGQGQEQIQTQLQSQSHTQTHTNNQLSQIRDLTSTSGQLSLRTQNMASLTSDLGAATNLLSKAAISRPIPRSTAKTHFLAASGPSLNANSSPTMGAMLLPTVTKGAFNSLILDSSGSHSGLREIAQDLVSSGGLGLTSTDTGSNYQTTPMSGSSDLSAPNNSSRMNSSNGTNSSRSTNMSMSSINNLDHAPGTQSLVSSSANWMPTTNTSNKPLHEGTKITVGYATGITPSMNSTNSTHSTYSTHSAYSTNSTSPTSPASSMTSTTGPGNADGMGTSAKTSKNVSHFHIEVDSVPSSHDPLAKIQSEVEGGGGLSRDPDFLRVYTPVHASMLSPTHSMEPFSSSSLASFSGSFVSSTPVLQPPNLTPLMVSQESTSSCEGMYGGVILEQVDIFS